MEGMDLAWKRVIMGLPLEDVEGRRSLAVATDWRWAAMSLMVSVAGVLAMSNWFKVNVELFEFAVKLDAVDDTELFMVLVLVVGVMGRMH
jgi:hypothetical protein